MHTDRTKGGQRGADIRFIIRTPARGTGTTPEVLYDCFQKEGLRLNVLRIVDERPSIVTSGPSTKYTRSKSAPAARRRDFTRPAESSVTQRSIRHFQSGLPGRPLERIFTLSLMSPR